MLQCGTSATGSQYDTVVVDAHILGIHNLVGLHVLQHTVLVNAAGVCKGITTHNSLVRLNGHVHQTRHHTTRRINLRRVDIRIDAQSLVALQNHGNLL